MLRSRTLWYALAVLLQVGVLLAMPSQKYNALISGQEVQLRVRPYDPMSFLSGRYANLSYDVASLSGYDDLLNVPDGTTLYCVLRPEDDGVWVQTRVEMDYPAIDPGMLILQGYKDRGRILFGIEAFFMPEEDAQNIETALRDGTVDCRAVVLVDEMGNALLRGLMLDGVRYEPGT